MILCFNANLIFCLDITVINSGRTGSPHNLSLRKELWKSHCHGIDRITEQFNSEFPSLSLISFNIIL